MKQLFDETLVNMFTNQLYNQSYMFYACMIGKFQLRFDNSNKAVADIQFKINKYILTINPSMFNKHCLEFRMGILKHECLHVIAKHLERFSGYKMDNRLNYSADCSINQLIDKNHLLPNAITFEYIQSLVDEPLLELQSAEYYYEKLANIDLGDQSDGHGQWDDSIGEDDMIDSITDDIIKDATQATTKMCGKIPTKINQILSVKKKRTVSWKRILRNLIHTSPGGKESTLKRPNRRFPDRLDIKGSKRSKKFNILVVWDVSGSVSDKASRRVLSEVKSIHDTMTKLSEMNLIQVDTEAFKPTKFTSKTRAIIRKGKGGTNLYPAMVMAKKERVPYDCVIVLTDGYLTQEDVDKFANHPKRVPIIWLITKGGNKANNILNNGESKRFSVVRL